MEFCVGPLLGFQFFSARALCTLFNVFNKINGRFWFFFVTGRSSIMLYQLTPTII